MFVLGCIKVWGFSDFSSSSPVFLCSGGDGSKGEQKKLLFDAAVKKKWIISVYKTCDPIHFQIFVGHAIKYLV